MTNNSPKDKFDFEARAYVVVGSALLIFGIWVFAYQCIHWLRTAHWIQQNVGTLWDWSGKKWPSFEWSGIQVISNWIMRLPLSVTSGFIGGAVLGRGTNRIEKENLR